MIVSYRLRICHRGRHREINWTDKDTDLLNFHERQSCSVKGDLIPDRITDLKYNSTVLQQGLENNLLRQKELWYHRLRLRPTRVYLAFFKCWNSATLIQAVRS